MFNVGEGGKLSGGKVFADCTVGAFDGFRLDVDGRIWTSAGDGVHCYEPDGTLIGKVMVPEVVANLVLRRHEAQLPLHRRHHLALHAVRLMVNGAKTY